MLRWLGETNEKDFGGTWSKKSKGVLNQLLKQFNNFKPMEIPRSVRSFEDIKFWKATEFRSFLLYYGIIILKDHLSIEEYNHFLLLTCAVRIFYVDVYTPFRQIAKNWLLKYVDEYINIFGSDRIGSNVHNLIHIFEDVEHLGCLNQISTYPFENRLHFLKTRLKQPNKSLQQIARRLVELSLDFDVLFGTSAQEKAYPELKFPFKLDNAFVYQQIEVDSNLTLSTRKLSDSWFLTMNNDIVRMMHAIKLNNEIMICGLPVKRKEIFFRTPVSSERLHIFKSDGEMNESSLFNLESVKAVLYSCHCYIH